MSKEYETKTKMWRDEHTFCWWGTPPSRENPDIFKLSASVAASKFCVWVQVGSDVYILDHRCQVKPHSSPSFSAACAAAIVHRNHFFICTNRINLLNVLKSRQAINHYKIVLEAARFPYANKTKESITSQRLGSWDFWRITNCVLNIGKSAIPPLLKQNCLLKTFLRTLILMTDLGISLPVFPSKTILKKHNIYVTP